MPKIVAIDGPSGSGKSTIAKMLAERLGFKYLDTGALYRATALGLVRAGVPEDASDDRVREQLKSIEVTYLHGKVYLNSEDVSDEIRTTQAGHYASVFSAKLPVREYLGPVQTRAGDEDDLVAEGRDMTTVIFVNAWAKFYIDATAPARAKRRFDQLVGKGMPITMEQAESDVILRDKRDSERDIAPLKVADDATYIDTSDMLIDEVMNQIIEKLNSKGVS